MAELSIQEILDEEEAGLGLELLAGATGLHNTVSVPKIQKPGLAIAGYIESLHCDRVQILGSTELSFLSQLQPDKAAQQIAQICSMNVAAFIITKGQEPPPGLVVEADRQHVPLLRTANRSSTIISLITKFLEERLLPTKTVHGVLVDVLGVGVLLRGKSGIGKSECALDLILRGYRLVADDVIRVRFKLPKVLFGEGMDLSQYHMEIRGLGILNIKHLFGVASIRKRKKIDMVLELTEWDEAKNYDRLGLEERYYRLLGVDLPLLEIPLHPGRNLSTMIEVAARNFVLKDMGYHSAREFESLLEKRMAETARAHSHHIIGDNLE